MRNIAVSPVRQATRTNDFRQRRSKMTGDLLAADLKTLQGTKDAIDLLLHYLKDELEASGHTYTVGLALCNGIQCAVKLLGETEQLEQELVNASGELLKLRMEA